MSLAARVLASSGRPLRPALGVLLALALVACGGSGSGDAGAGGASPVPTSTVDLPRSYRFEPVAITVPAGTTVTWTNNDNFTHNVSLDGVEPLTMRPGESASHAFAAAGSYPYVCSLHPQDMQGTVVVTT